ncbi:unnamed protein product [Rotaria sp. Silwood1]|nr:unnamed protein product [Rotaria sp. Silwood1]CAF1691095.1 unnamed protein product [Rotaria sp. Silwood1]
MAERNFFDFAKHIPVAGYAYGVVRGVAYRLADDREEAKHSLEMDLADLNPLRMPRNLVNSLVNSTCNLDKGIWIGRRSLGNQPYSLTFSPGSDVYHWCIQIDGIIYELDKLKNQIVINIISEENNPTTYQSYCRRFSWTMLTREPSSVSKSTLQDYAESFKQYNYQLILSSNNTVNCQFFVKYMFAKATNISTERAAGIIYTIIPNILF